MTMRGSADGQYYTDAQIAALLGISLGRLRNKVCGGSPLPPWIQPPGCRQRLWPRCAVHAWLEQFTITASDSSAYPERRRRRGRPTKLEERTRQR